MLDYPLSSKTHIQSVIKSYWILHSGIFLLLSLYFSNPVLHPYPIYSPHCPWNNLRINLSWLISCNYCSYPTVYISQYGKLFMICMSHNSFTTAPPYLSSPNYLQCWTAAAAKSLQSCSTPCDPIDGSPPDSPVPGILQARTLEWVAISFSNAWKWKVKVKPLSCVQLLETPLTAAHQAPPSMGFSRQESWSGVPLPSPSVMDYSTPFHFSVTLHVLVLPLGMSRSFLPQHSSRTFTKNKTKQKKPFLISKEKKRTDNISVSGVRLSCTSVCSVYSLL